MPFEGFWASQNIITSLSISFGIIAKPRTDLLRKDNFQWSSDTDEALSALKLAFSSTPMLVFPKFTNPFTIEYNASISILVQSYSRTITPLNFLAIHWHWDIKLSLCMIKKCLQWFLQHKSGIRICLAINSRFSWTIKLWNIFLISILLLLQEKWLLKLLGHNYTLEYRPDTSSKVADALFRHSEMLSLIGLSQPFFTALQKFMGHIHQCTIPSLGDAFINKPFSTPCHGLIAGPGKLGVF